MLIAKRNNNQEIKAQRNRFFKRAKRLIVRTKERVDNLVLLRIEFAYCNKLAKRTI
jgi:hypothetical protein